MDHPEQALDSQATVPERTGLGREAVRRWQQHEVVDPDSKGSSSALQKGHRATLAAVGGIGDDLDEDTPLLAREETASLGGLAGEQGDGDSHNGNGPAPEWPGTVAFAGVPWWRRPSVYWLLPSLLVHTLAFGGILVPKLTLILNLICRDYFADKAFHDPNFTWNPVIFDGTQDNPQCEDAVIQKLVAEFNLAISLISGLISMTVAPKLGALSDRYGRTRVIAYCGLGVLLNEIITVLAASYPEVISVNWLLFGAVLDGLSGTFITAAAVTNAYAADCTPPGERAIAFGRLHGCLFAGIALGPFLASFMMAITKSTLSFFYFALGVHAFFLIYTIFIIPESLTLDRQLAARASAKARDAVAATAFAEEERRPNKPWHRRGIVRVLVSILTLPKELVAPLAILWPTRPGSTPVLRRNLALLAAIDCVLFGVAMSAITIVVLYSKWMFKWGTVESSNFVGAAASVRVFSVLVVLPIITRLVRGKPPQDGRLPARSPGSDSLDLALIRIAITLDVLGYIGYITARQGGIFIASGCIAAFGGFGSPTMQSALTKHVPPEVTGQLLGATGLLHGAARVGGPVIFNLIYASTVGYFPQTVFICLCATFGVALVMSLFLRPHVYLEVFDESSPLSRQGSRPTYEDEWDDEIIR